MNRHPTWIETRYAAPRAIAKSLSTARRAHDVVQVVFTAAAASSMTIGLLFRRDHALPAGRHATRPCGC